MVLGRRELSVILLGVAAILFYLVLLSTTPSGAQTSGVDPAGDECDVVGTGDSGAQRSPPDGNEDEGDRQVQDEDEGGQQARDQNAVDELPAQNGAEDGDRQQTQQNETGDNGDPATSQDGESVSPSSDEEENAEDECDDVIAETVPDELLPPTGAPAKPPTDDPATEKERESNPDEQKSDGSK